MSYYTISVEDRTRYEQNDDIRKERFEENRKAKNQDLAKLNCIAQINHFRMQEKILVDNLENAKTDAERFKYARTLSFCRANLSKWLKLAEQQNGGR